MKELKIYLSKAKDFQLSKLAFISYILGCYILVFHAPRSATTYILEGILLFLTSLCSINEISAMELKDTNFSKEICRKIKFYMVIALTIFVLLSILVNQM
ncbi:MAG: hypothetical protein E6538_13370 [Paeniclostridium sordellii]|nr:hypothetical protein [Paeniclostridium sordellii]